MTVHTLGQLIDSPVLADDGTRGTVLDAFFDERDWSIRFLLVQCTSAGPPSPVLVPAEAVTQIDSETDRIRVERFPDVAAGSDPALDGETVMPLRSSRSVLGCHVSGWGSSLGRTQDAVFETSTWEMRFLLIDASSWCEGARVLVEPELVDEMRLDDKTIRVAVTRDEILVACNGAADELGTVQRDLSLH